MFKGFLVKVLSTSLVVWIFNEYPLSVMIGNIFNILLHNLGLKIPILSIAEKKQILLNFNNEIKMYNEIDKISTDIKQIHNNFLGVNR